MKVFLLHLAQADGKRETWRTPAAYVDVNVAHEAGRTHTYRDPSRRYRVEELELVPKDDEMIVTRKVTKEVDVPDRRPRADWADRNDTSREACGGGMGEPCPCLCHTITAPAEPDYITGAQFLKAADAALAPLTEPEFEAYLKEVEGENE
jgi:hypothetical protein